MSLALDLPRFHLVFSFICISYYRQTQTKLDTIAQRDSVGRIRWDWDAKGEEGEGCDHVEFLSHFFFTYTISRNVSYDYKRERGVVNSMKQQSISDDQPPFFPPFFPYVLRPNKVHPSASSSSLQSTFDGVGPSCQNIFFILNALLKPNHIKLNSVESYIIINSFPLFAQTWHL